MSAAITSVAFRQAHLRTERLRILGSTFIISVFVITGAIRIYLFGLHMKYSGLHCAAMLIGYELLVLRAVQHSIKAGRPIPDCFWTVNVIIEMSIPPLGLAFVASDRIALDYLPWRVHGCCCSSPFSFFPPCD